MCDNNNYKIQKKINKKKTIPLTQSHAVCFSFKQNKKTKITIFFVPINRIYFCIHFAYTQCLLIFFFMQYLNWICVIRFFPHLKFKIKNLLPIFSHNFLLVFMHNFGNLSELIVNAVNHAIDEIIIKNTVKWITFKVRQLKLYSLFRIKHFIYRIYRNHFMINIDLWVMQRFIFFLFSILLDSKFGISVNLRMNETES